MGWSPNSSQTKIYLELDATKYLQNETVNPIPSSVEMDPANSERFMVAVLTPKIARRPGEVNTTRVRMSFPAIYKISCPMNVKYFPWDEQSCHMEFISWSYDQTNLNYNTTDDASGSESYIRNQEYDLLSFTSKTVVRCFTYIRPDEGGAVQILRYNKPIRTDHATRCFTMIAILRSSDQGFS